MMMTVFVRLYHPYFDFRCSVTRGCFTLILGYEVCSFIEDPTVIVKYRTAMKVLFLSVLTNLQAENDEHPVMTLHQMDLWSG